MIRDSTKMRATRSLVHVTSGRQSWSPSDHFERHQHNQAYAAIVLAGSYEECGSRGRFLVEPGDVLLHTEFESHRDRFYKKGAQVLNVLLDGLAISFGVGRVSDPDAIVRAASTDSNAAANELHAQLKPTNSASRDWPDLLAAEILRDTNCSLRRWAQRHSLAEETISRGFRKVFETTPAAFRAEVRALQAFEHIKTNCSQLKSIAASTGFADQAHMSRSVRALTGRSPNGWRRSI
jgi:AraC-like DNA-binding protein